MAIDRITHTDLQAMIGRDAEGDHLEFKVDIPVSRESQREQAVKNIVPPRDGWWSGKAVGNHGRDELLEEVVAFANAHGGCLYLGIDEENDTTLAKAICPIPNVVDLAGRFRNHLLSCVEPRLPHMDVVAVETDGQGGGVLIIEVEASRLGPHRVTGTLQIPIRRGDKCMPLTMSEVHEMVLRNSRRFDQVQATLMARMADTEPAFRAFLTSKIDTQIAGGTADSRIGIWLRQKSFSAYGVRITICAHDDLGIQRLQSFDPLIPKKTCVAEQTAQGPIIDDDMIAFWPEPGHSEKFLGGVRQITPWSSGLLEFRALRDGVVEITIFFINLADQNILTSQEIAGYLGCCLGIYDNLRTAAGRPSMPAEVAVAVFARGTVLSAVSRQSASIIGKILPDKCDFPHRSIADAADFSELLNVTSQDLLDAANVKAHSPNFVYSPN
jgi:hypothetical protein